MNRTIKDATLKRYYYQTHEQLKDHLQTFLMAYSFARRLKTLKGLTPYEFVCKTWIKEPNRFRINPIQHTVGLNIKSGQACELDISRVFQQDIIQMDQIFAMARFCS